MPMSTVERRVDGAAVLEQRRTRDQPICDLWVFGFEWRSVTSEGGEDTRHDATVLGAAGHVAAVVALRGIDDRRVERPQLGHCGVVEEVADEARKEDNQAQNKGALYALTLAMLHLSEALVGLMMDIMVGLGLGLKPRLAV
eukprot:scaffold14885_cov65-Phaeocystis_antarctica.AAC.5